MLHYDGLLDCADTSDKKSSSSSGQTHLSFLKEHPLEAVNKESLARVKYSWFSILFFASARFSDLAVPPQDFTCSHFTVLQMYLLSFVAPF